MLDLLQRLEYLRDGELANREAVATAALRLFTRAIGVLLRQETRKLR